MIELRQKGIADEVIDDVLSALDEEKLAFRAAQKQSHKFAQLEWPDFRQKMIAFLARRGFNYGVAGPTVKKLWEDMQSTQNAVK